MAKFLTTSATSYRIENIIMKAKQKLVLVSPFLQLSKTLLERLQDAIKRNVEIKIIYGKDELKPHEKNSLSELKNLKLYYLENLHAKCYCNENEMVITSMNMYQFSEKNNREMGVYLDSTKDKQLFEEAVDETNSIIRHSKEIQMQGVTNSGYQRKTDAKNNLNQYFSNAIPELGFCLRCERQILYDPCKPLCYDCFSTWSQFGNMEFNEKVCHSCGENTNPISMAKPLCYSCSRKY